MRTFAVDAAIIAVIALQVVMGWRYGLVRRGFALVGTFAGVIAASYAGNPLATVVRPENPDANTLCFLAIFAAITLGFELVGALTSHHLRNLLVVVFDRVSGAIAGAIIGTLQVGLAALVLVSAARVDGATSTALNDDVHHAALGSAVLSLQPGVRALFTPVLPPDLDGHLAAGHHIS